MDKIKEAWVVFVKALFLDEGVFSKHQCSVLDLNQVVKASVILTCTHDPPMFVCIRSYSFFDMMVI